jgi:hypothetical protein
MRGHFDSGEIVYHQQTTPTTTEDRSQAPPPWPPKGELRRSNQNKRRHLPSPRGRSNKLTTKQQRGAKGRGKAG